MSGGQIVYGLEFLEVFPEYLCLNQTASSVEYFSCNHTYIYDNNFCHDHSLFKVDVSDQNYFKNWVSPDKLDLLCYDDALIGLLGSMFFVGFAISSLVVSPLSDRVGRKYPHFVSMVV